MFTEEKKISSDLKAVFSGFYDLQKMRIQAGNRIVANFKIRLGQEPSKPEDTMDREGKKILQKVRDTYKLMADAAKDMPAIGKFKGNEVISTYAELTLAHIYESLLEQENQYFRPIKSMIHQYPIWNEFLKGVSGCGELMALVIIALIDIHEAKYPSSLWKYAGLDVAPDGAGRSRRSEHLEKRSYITRDGETKTKDSITFNPVLKTKLIGVLGPSFLRAGNQRYSKIYADYKNRLKNHPKYRDGGTAPRLSKSGKKLPSAKQHRHNMAIRYMVKIFLIDLYDAWRRLEKLPVSKPYHEAKLGIVHNEKMAS